MTVALYLSSDFFNHAFSSGVKLSNNLSLDWDYNC